MESEVGAPYRGRFAPTPSGPLHFGSLIAAVASYLEARSRSGEWLLRMEDLDPPRVMPGAAGEILRTLESFGFEWDGDILWQSARTPAYRDAFERLRREGKAYACSCSRTVQEGSNCAKNCAAMNIDEVEIRSWRARGGQAGIKWNDRLRGPQHDPPPGDFVVLRGDGVFAYQLAVAVDDAEQGVTDVVRGADLLDSTSRQIRLQRLLGLPEPGYLHLPIARDSHGQKLSKQTRAPALRHGDAEQLAEALRFLGQPAPSESLSLQDLWQWSLQEWRPGRIPS